MKQPSSALAEHHARLELSRDTIVSVLLRRLEALEGETATLRRRADALARGNAALRESLSPLAREPDLRSFLGHVLAAAVA